LTDRAPVCPLHRKAMIRAEMPTDTHYRCGKRECPIHWNSTDALFYLKKKGDWPLREGNDGSN
jgi:hypothetical protein